MSRIKKLLPVLLMLCCNVLLAQERTLTGTVRNSANAPVVGATVSQKGTLNDTVTNDNGSFSLRVPAGSVVLTISSIGYSAEDVTVAAAAAIADISLSDASQQISEMVITALAFPARQKTMVYATQSAKPAEFTEARDTNNMLNSWQVKVANAVITQGSGAPGSGAGIVLHGNRSLLGNNNALIVEVGVPFSNGTNGTGTSDFSSVQD